jgi:hypothetical protein
VTRARSRCSANTRNRPVQTACPVEVGGDFDPLCLAAWSPPEVVPKLLVVIELCRACLVNRQWSAPKLGSGALSRSLDDLATNWQQHCPCEPNMTTMRRRAVSSQTVSDYRFCNISPVSRRCHVGEGNPGEVVCRRQSAFLRETLRFDEVNFSASI